MENLSHCNSTHPTVSHGTEKSIARTTQNEYALDILSYLELHQADQLVHPTECLQECHIASDEKRKVTRRDQSNQWVCEHREKQQTAEELHELTVRRK